MWEESDGWGLRADRRLGDAREQRVLGELFGLAGAASNRLTRFNLVNQQSYLFAINKYIPKLNSSQFSMN